MTTADFNLDGNPDIAVTTTDLSAGTATVSILRGNGNGTFQAAQNTSVSGSPGAITVADFNADGNPDVMLANMTGSNLLLLTGNGDGTFGASSSLIAGNDPLSIGVADFNGDGRVDAVVANAGDGTISLFFGAAVDTVTLASSASPSAYGQSITLTATISSVTAAGEITFYDGAKILATRNVSNGQALFSTTFLPPGTHVLRAVYSGDASDAISFSTGLIQVITPNAQNGLTALGAEASSNGPISIAAGDFNNDGKPDLAVAGNADNSVRIQLGNGNGTLSSGNSYAVGASPASVAVADLNGDGNLDAVVANAGSATISVLLGNGDGTLQAPVNYAASGSPVSIGLGDFNRDAHPDIVVANASGLLDVLPGRGDGTFGLATSYSSGKGLTSVTVSDLNGDGIPDLIGVNNIDGTISILSGNGDGSFAAAVSYAAGTSPEFATTGDFNGDGKTDVAVTTYDVTSGSGGAAVLLGNGNGTLQNATQYFVGALPLGIVTGDFNGDGHTDLAVANKLSNNVSILYGNVDGSFNLPPPSRPAAVPLRSPPPISTAMGWQISPSRISTTTPSASIWGARRVRT